MWVPSRPGKIVPAAKAHGGTLHSKTKVEPYAMPRSLKELMSAKRSLVQVLYRWKTREVAETKGVYSKGMRARLKSPMNKLKKKGRQSLVALFLRQDSKISRQYQILAEAWSNGQLDEPLTGEL